MKAVRTVATAIALVLAMFTVSAGPALAAVVQPACPSHEHDCCQTAKVAAACCRVQSNPSGPSAPAQDKVQIPTDSSFVVSAPVHAYNSETIRRALLVQTSPRAAPVDLCTLFACLLI